MRDSYYTHLESEQASQNEAVTQVSNSTRKTFIELKQNITVTHFGRNNHKGIPRKFYPTMEQMKIFIQLRTKVTQFRTNRPVYKKMDTLSKDELIDMCISHINHPLQPRIYKNPITDEEDSDDDESMDE